LKEAVGNIQGQSEAIQRADCPRSSGWTCQTIAALGHQKQN
jgi:hypothetical protein